jgi:uncharacterized membrane protein YbaN (DUF454 family)
LKNRTPPILPYLGVLLTDLAFLDNSNINEFNVNWMKRKRIGECIQKFRRYQAVPFHFKEVPEISTLLINWLNDAKTFDEATLYNKSLSIQPTRQ